MVKPRLWLPETARPAEDLRMTQKDVVAYVNEFLQTQVPKGWRFIGYFAQMRRNLSVSQIDKLPDASDLTGNFFFAHLVNDDLQQQIPFEFSTYINADHEDIAPEGEHWSKAQCYAYQVAGAISSSLYATQAEAQ
jgi:hypothetical protein